MNNLEFPDNRIELVIIPALDEQSTNLEKEIELAKSFAFNEYTEYITKQQELEAFHSDPSYIKLLCLERNYESELDKATQLLQKSKIENDTAVKI